MATASDTSYAGVLDAYNSTSTDETLLIPSGQSTWTTAITFSKPIIVQGAGIGNTIIVNGLSTSNTALIVIEPSDYTINGSFRLTGITFDANDNRILDLGVSSKVAPFTLQTKIRIDHNRFTNSGTGTDLKGQAVWNYGTLYGVFDNNTIDGFGYPIAHSYGCHDDSGWWQNSPQNIFEHGSIYYMYFEDNTITLTQYNGADNILTDGEYGARYVFRYNTITNEADTYSLFECHGQNSVAMPACFGMELYGNQITHGSNYCTFWKQRSGQTLVFLNNFTGTTTPNLNAYTTGGGSPDICSLIYPELKITHNTYWFGSRSNLTGSLIAGTCDGGLDCAGLEDIPTLGRDVFSDNSTPGVGMGTLADIPSTCTIGQGYWVTNQSVSDLSGMVGVNPSITILGSLYRCEVTDSWTIYYVPYTYPHPLRGEIPHRMKMRFL